MKNIELVNLTPHDVNIIIEDKTLTIATSGTIARCEVTREKTQEIKAEDFQIPINKTVFGEVENLPKPQENTLYIVSSLVAQAVPNRSDVVIPDDTVRNDKGQIIGCRGLAHI